MLDKIKNGNCPLCDSTEIKYWRTYKTISLNKCKKCALVFKRGLCPEYYESGLAEDYYNDQLCNTKTIYHSKAIYNWLKTYMARGRWLDIGCSVGQLLQFANKDFDVYGIDSSEKAIKQCEISMPSGNFVCGLFEKTDSFKDNYFDVITMIEVIEHIPEPNLFLQKVYQKLKPGGVVLTATGNTKSVFAILMKDSWPYFTKDHLLYYNIKTLSFLLERNGFKILEKNAPVKFKHMLGAYSCSDNKLSFLRSCLAKFYFYGYTYNGMAIIANKT
ncbi:MAG: class I SAM-dependent methyltransferase [Thermodesulfobacteriota bacterium]